MAFIPSFLRTIHRTPYRLAQREEGGVLIMVGLSVFLLFALGGSAIDLGAQQLVRNRLQQATDASALAAASLKEGTSDEVRRNTALRYFKLNYPETFLGTERPEPDIQVSAGSVTVSTPNIPVNTRFINLSSNAQSVAGAKTTVSTLSSATDNKYDIILVMDNSGSMSEKDGGNRTRMEALQNAANILVDDILSGTQENRIASITWDDGLIASLPFTDNASTVHDFINRMMPEGCTNSNVGIVEAMMTAQAARRAEDGVARVVILLTDGVNGCFGSKPPLTTPDVNTLSLASITNLKGMGFLVHSIAFGKDVTKTPCTYNDDGKHPNAVASMDQTLDPVYCPRPFLAHIASGSTEVLSNGLYANEKVYYHVAPTPAELGEIFKNITESIRKIRVSE